MIKNIRALAVIGAMVLFPVAVFAEDVPMTEEEVCLNDIGLLPRECSRRRP